MRGKITLVSLVTGLLLYIFDLASDIYVAVQYYKRGEIWWMALTLVFVIFPFIVINCLACFHSLDSETHNNWVVCGLCCACNSVSFRYLQELGQWRRENWKYLPCGEMYRTCLCKKCSLFREEREKSAKSLYTLATVRYHETILESVPQWCLQNYVMLRQWYFPWYTIVSTIISFISLAWSITTLEKARKIKHCYEEGEEPNVKWTSVLVFLAWKVFALLARLSSLVIFAYSFRYHVFTFIALHFLVVSAVNPTLTCGACATLVCPVLLYFFGPFFLTLCFSNVFTSMFQIKTGDKSVCKILMYHTLFVFENILLTSLSVWIPPSHIHDNTLRMIIFFFVFGGEVMATVFILLYLKCFKDNLSCDLSIIS